MENTKEFITYNVCLDREFIHHVESSHKTYSQAKQYIADKLNEYPNKADMRDDNKAYWIGRYQQAFIVESICKYTVIE
jgi:hypothetical protein